jgi:hypothetical protein
MPDAWTMAIEPAVLLPGRSARVRVTLLAARDLRARGVRASLRGVERWRYDDTETSLGADGHTETRTVTRTGEQELARQEWDLAGEMEFPAGEHVPGSSS